MILPTCLVCVAALAPAPQAAERPALRPPSALEDELVRLERAHPSSATRIALGSSSEGRAIHALRLAPTPLVAGRPALLLIGGLHHERAFEAGLVADLAGRVLADYAAGDERARALLEAFTLYAVPAPNPDDLARALAAPLGASVGSVRDVDNDRDGRRGEDPPADVDGDGLVLTMRVPDADGDLAADPHDPRAHVPADPRSGLPATWRAAVEGRDADGDGRVGEDPAGDRLFATNFPAAWPEHAASAGRWPTDDPAARALCDFVVAHEDLVAVLALGAIDNLASPPKQAGPASGRVPATGPTEDDLALLSDVAERYRDATGVKHAAEADDAGSFQRWAYDHRGLWTFAARPWTLPTEAPEETPAAEEADATADGAAPADDGTAPARDGTAPAGDGDAPDGDATAGAGDAAPSAPEPAGEPSDDAGRLAWIDATGETWRFAPWAAFDHPELGPVEIGGFTPFAHALPPASDHASIADAQLAFLYSLADLPASQTIERFDAEVLGDGLWRLELVVRNDGWLPTRSDAARRARTVRPTRVVLALPDGATLLGGRTHESVPILAAGASHTLHWLVQAPALDGLRAELTSPNAGLAAATPTAAEDAR